MNLILNVLIKFILTITLLQHRCYGMLLGYACLESVLKCSVLHVLFPGTVAAGLNGSSVSHSLQHRWSEF